VTSIGEGDGVGIATSDAATSCSRRIVIRSGSEMHGVGTAFRVGASSAFGLSWMTTGGVVLR